LDAIFVCGTEIASFVTMGKGSMNIANRRLSVLALAGLALTGLALTGLALTGLVTAAQAGPNLVTNGSFSGINAGNNVGGNTCGTSDTTTAQLTNCDLPNWYWAPSGGGSASGLNPGSNNYTFILNNAASGSGNYGNYTAFNSISNSTLGLKGTITTPPDNGTNWIGADGAFQTSYLYTTVTGLIVGAAYNITFYMGANQQTGFTGQTTSTWQVGLSTGTGTCTFPGANSSPGTCLPNTGTTTSKTPTAITLANTATGYTGPNAWSGWMGEEVNLLAAASTEVLWFLAIGTPGSSQPPFALLDGVSMQIPEPPAYGLLMVGMLGLLGARRAWRRKI
jgi:hypothetical protein